VLRFLDRRLFRIYVIPGAVFQSIMVGGGYGTGREIVEYFTSFGAVGGLLAIAVATSVLGLVIATTFEFARLFGAYDYRRFFRHLLGPGWLAFEVLMIMLFLLILAVLASAAGNIVQENFGMPYALGLAIMMGAIGVLTFYGRELIEKTLTLWTFFLYAVFIAFFVTVFGSGDVSLVSAFATASTQDGWLTSGLKYALYNLAVTPLILYVIRGFESRGQALRSGAVAALIAMCPAVLFHLAFVTAWPDVLGEDIPAYWMMTQFGALALLTAFSVMLFGTFIETGAGLLQGINERIDGYLLEKGAPSLRQRSRALIAVCAILVSAGLSFWGITNLIAKGYGMMAWGFLVVYVVPLMTIGVYRIWKQG
jgi:uncharacterized membrane protein YkvI